MSAMKISQGVEWATHACALLASLPEGWCLRGVAIAAFHELPPAYMAKHLQALSRGGLLASSRGAQGGYYLAVSAEMVSLWDIEMAILGSQPRFVCQNIRSKGPCASHSPITRPCEIACAFWDAEQAYRSRLEATSVADIARSVATRYGSKGRRDAQAWIIANATRIPEKSAS
jgi:Rrf2 family protein